ncbi:MAG TPA: hypothetical protein VFQ61_09930 [Polyangiaceae bacterium]|nr:hypothetical protein [Polyangiaceae bacterium]
MQCTRRLVVYLIGWLMLGCAPAHPSTEEPERLVRADPPAIVPPAPQCPVRVCAGACTSSAEGTEYTKLATCNEPLPLIARGSLQSGLAERVVTGHKLCGTSYSSGAECGLDGEALTFELDLRDSPREVDLLVEFDAEFDPTLRLETGACEDPQVVACNRNHTEQVERAVLSQRLKPGLYHLVAGAEGQHSEGGASAEGAFRLAVTARDPEARCQRPPPNDTCATATPLDPTLEFRTLVGSTTCARDDAWSTLLCAYDNAPDVFYRIELPEELGPRILRASTDLPETNFDTVLYVLEGSHGHCFDVLACNDDVPEPVIASSPSEVSILLDPGEYYLVVDGSYDTGDFGLNIEFSAPECLRNDDCSRALPLDPSFGNQTAPIDVTCATSTRVVESYEDDQPKDAFYRLDLSAATGLVRLNVDTDLDDVFGFSAGLIAEERPGICGQTLLTKGFWRNGAVVEPGIYYIVISVPLEEWQRGNLEVEIEPVSEDELTSCVDAAMAADANLYCSDDWEMNFMQFSACGLAPALQSCVCEAAPRCCTPAGRFAECIPAFEACNLFCPDFDLQAYCEDA